MISRSFGQGVDLYNRYCETWPWIKSITKSVPHNISRRDLLEDSVIVWKLDLNGSITAPITRCPSAVHTSFPLKVRRYRTNLRWRDHDCPAVQGSIVGLAAGRYTGAPRPECSRKNNSYAKIAIGTWGILRRGYINGLRRVESCSSSLEHAAVTILRAYTPGPSTIWVLITPTQ